ncbi:MAG: alpha/beta fold hydrolase [Chitinophagaceae bacterium]|nr:alpha/beta fold hydrolase [Chitinophagaceae bacterium]
MKMKLAQRVVIGYYKTKLRTLELVSVSKAAEQAFKIFCTPYVRSRNTTMPALFHNAEPLEMTLEGLRLRGFRWLPKQANGRKALVAHGFSSRSYKFEKYIQLLLRQGYEVVAFDAPAHGLSEGKTIHAILYKRMLLAVDARWGVFDLMLAHSLGGLATALAITETDPQIRRKLVLIAPATETRSAMDGFIQLMHLSRPVSQALEDLIIQLAERPLDYFSVTRSVQQVAHPVLWIHDKGDRICPYADTLPAQALALPHVQFHITEGLGHNRIYRDAQVVSRVQQFLQEAW